MSDDYFDKKDHPQGKKTKKSRFYTFTERQLIGV